MDAGASKKFVRDVGGRLIGSIIATTPSARIEILRRESSSAQRWHFCQPEPALFWHRAGFTRLDGSIGGSKVACKFEGQSRLSLFPSGTEIWAEVEALPVSDYVAVFFKQELFDRYVGASLDQPCIAFSHEELTNGLTHVCRHANEMGDMFQLFAEGWALQALAHVAGLGRARPRSTTTARGGLSLRSAGKLKAFIRENLSQPITLDALAEVTNLSKRHLIRAFRQSFGTTPHSYLTSVRIEEARRILGSADVEIAAIAAMCGFQDAQHFSTVFKRDTGLTPTAFRARAHLQ